MPRQKQLCLKLTMNRDGKLESDTRSRRMLEYHVGKKTTSNYGPIFARQYTADGLGRTLVDYRGLLDISVLRKNGSPVLLLCEYQPYENDVQRILSPLYFGGMPSADVGLFWNDFDAFKKKYPDDDMVIELSATYHYNGITTVVDTSKFYVFAKSVKPIEIIEDPFSYSIGG